MSEPKCEACGTIGRPKYVRVHTVNGGLNLCAECLAEINGKNPEVKAIRERMLRLEYVARIAILTGYSYRDDDRTDEWFTAELGRLQQLLRELVPA